MAIYVQSLFDAKTRKYGATPAEVVWIQIFLDAINYVLDDIHLTSDITSARIEQVGDTIVLDEQTWRGVLDIGLDHYLSNLSQYVVQDKATVKGLYKEKLALASTANLRDEAPHGRKGDLS